MGTARLGELFEAREGADAVDDVRFTSPSMILAHRNSNDLQSAMLVVKTTFGRLCARC